MDSSFTGEIRAFAFDYVPAGWLPCDGSIYSVGQYAALFSIVSIAFGGDGRTTFGVPDLRGKAVAGVGTTTPLPAGVAFVRQYGKSYGNKNVTLTQSNIPNHTHALQRVAANYAAKTALPSSTSELGNLEKSDTDIAALFVPAATNDPNTSLNPGTIGPYGSATAQKVSTLMPYAALWFGICWDGTYPPRP